METSHELSATIKVRVTEQTKRELEARAAADGRSVGSLVRVYLAIGIAQDQIEEVQARRV